MIKWNVGMKIGTGFGLALAVLVAIGSVSYRNTAKMSDAAQWVTHTHTVLENLDSVLSGDEGCRRPASAATSSPGDEKYLEPPTTTGWRRSSNG